MVVGTGINGRPESGLKNIVFKLKNYFLIDAFSEEFIAYDGIKVLLNLVFTCYISPCGSMS